MEAFSKKFDLMFEKISGMEIKLSNVENRVSGIENRMDSNEEKFDVLAININNLDNKLEKYNKELRKDIQNTKLEFLDKLLETEKRLIQKLAPIDLVNNHETRIQKLELKGNI